MNNFDYTDADSDATLAAFRSELHEYMRSYSQDCAPQGIHTVTSNENLQGLNVPHDTTSITVPTTLMGTFMESIYKHPVSKQPQPLIADLVLPCRTTENPGGLVHAGTM